MKLSRKISGLAIALLTSSFYANAQIPTTTFSSFNDGKIAYILSASLENGSMNCGPGQAITNGWKVDTEALFDHTGVNNNNQVASTGGHFNAGTGTFTAPVDGYYHVDVSMRIERQAGDITLRLNNVAIAGFGTDLVERLEDLTGNNLGPTGPYWSSHSVAKNVYMTTGQTLHMVYESGQSNDCSYDTSFHYGQFNVNLIRATSNPS